MRQESDTRMISSDIREELRCLYCMLLEALPLARKSLMLGAVSLSDQQAFWEAYRDLEKYGDFDEENMHGPSGILSVIDLLSVS